MADEQREKPRMSLGRFFFWFGLIPAGVAVLVVLLVERDALARGGYPRDNAIIAAIMLPVMILVLCPMAHYVCCVPGPTRKKPLWRSVGEILLVIIFIPWSIVFMLIMDSGKRRPLARTRQVRQSRLNRPIYSLDGPLWWAPIAMGWSGIAFRVLGIVMLLADGVAPDLFDVFVVVALAPVMIWLTVYLRRRRRRVLWRMRRAAAPPLPVSPPTSSAPTRVQPAAEIDWTTPILSKKARKAREEKLSG